MPRYISRVYVVIDAANGLHAEDVMRDALEERLRDAGHIVDWAYTPDGNGDFTSPCPVVLPPRTRAPEDHGYAVEYENTHEVFLVSHAADLVSR